MQSQSDIDNKSASTELLTSKIETLPSVPSSSSNSHDMMWPDASWNYTELSNVYFDGHNTSAPQAQSNPSNSAPPSQSGVNMHDISTQQHEQLPPNIEHWPPNAVFNTHQRLNSLPHPPAQPDDKRSENQEFSGAQSSDTKSATLVAAPPPSTPQSQIQQPMQAPMQQPAYLQPQSPSTVLQLSHQGVPLTASLLPHQALPSGNTLMVIGPNGMPAMANLTYWSSMAPGALSPSAPQFQQFPPNSFPASAAVPAKPGQYATYLVTGPPVLPQTYAINPQSMEHFVKDASLPPSIVNLRPASEEPRKRDPIEIVAAAGSPKDPKMENENNFDASSDDDSDESAGLPFKEVESDDEGEIDAEYLKIVEEVTGEPSFALSRVKDKYAPVAPRDIMQCSQPVLSARTMIATAKPLFSLAVGPAKHQVKEFNILPFNVLKMGYKLNATDYIVISLLCDKKMKRKEPCIFLTAISPKRCIPTEDSNEVVVQNLKISKEMIQGRTKGFKFYLLYSLYINGQRMCSIKSDSFYLWSNINQQGFPRHQREKYLSERKFVFKSRRKR